MRGLPSHQLAQPHARQLLRQHHQQQQPLRGRAAQHGTRAASSDQAAAAAPPATQKPPQPPPPQRLPPPRRGPLPPPPGARGFGRQQSTEPQQHQPQQAEQVQQQPQALPQQQPQALPQQQPPPQPQRQPPPQKPASPYWWKAALKRNKELQRQQALQRQQMYGPQAGLLLAATAARSSPAASNGSHADTAAPASAAPDSRAHGGPAAAAVKAPTQPPAAAETSSAAAPAAAPAADRLSAARAVMEAAMAREPGSFFGDTQRNTPEPVHVAGSSFGDGGGADAAEAAAGAGSSSGEPEQQQQPELEPVGLAQPPPPAAAGLPDDAGKAGQQSDAAAATVTQAPAEPAAASSGDQSSSSSSSSGSGKPKVGEAGEQGAAAGSRMRRSSRRSVSSSSSTPALEEPGDAPPASTSKRRSRQRSASSPDAPAAAGSSSPRRRSRRTSSSVGAATAAADDATAASGAAAGRAAAGAAAVHAGPATDADRAPEEAEQQLAADGTEALPPSSSPPPAEGTDAAAAGRRRVRSSTSGTGTSAATVELLLSGQRTIAAARRRQAGGGAPVNGNSSSSSSGGEPGKIVQVAGQWVMVGFSEDVKAMDSLVPALQQRLRSAVEAEQQHEAAAIEALYARSSLKKLERDGLVLLRLAAAPHSVLYSSMVWRFSLARQQQQQLPTHRFRQGDSLLVSRFGAEQAAALSGSNGSSSNGSSSNGSSSGLGGPAGSSPADLQPDVQGFRPLDATVLEVRKDHLLLTLDKTDSDLLQLVLRRSTGAMWRLDQSVRDTTARRQLEAVKRLSHPTPDSPFEALLRQVLVCCPSADFMASIPPCWVRDGSWRSNVHAMLQATTGLNDSQKRAIARAVMRTATLWQGPPGTGKTRTLLTLVEVLVRTARAQPPSWSGMGPILACADTNAAVDNLVEGLMSRGLRVVRLGQPAKVRDNLRKLTLEAQAEATPDGQKAAALRESSKALFERAKQQAEGRLLGWGAGSSRSLPRNGSSSSSSGGRAGSPGARSPPAGARGASPVSSEATEAEARRKWAQAEALMRSAAKQVLERAEVVCATCAGAGDPLLNNLQFKVVVIDEATQATEPATLVPLTQGAECVVMAGDPCQLPPTITSREAAQVHGLATTLFERLQRQAGIETLLLDTQYRMHPAIAQFPSRWFYGGALKDGVAAADKPAALGLQWPQPGQPVMVVAVQGLEERAQRSGAKANGADLLVYGGGPAYDDAAGLMEASYRNLPEARVALQALHALMAAGDIETAAILTPYKGQVRAFEHALRVLAPWFGPDLLARVSVSSVDGFQGREADAIVFSAVRCNARGKVGFVDDPRRLNVAITRPRRGVAVVCCPDTLAAGSADWAAFLAHARGAGWVASAQGLPPPLWTAEGVDPFAPAAGAGSGSSGLSSYEEALEVEVEAGAASASGGRRPARSR